MSFSFFLSTCSYYQSFRDHLNEKKKIRKEAERQRLFELAEQKYTYRSPLTSNDTSFVEICNGGISTRNDEKIKKETASGKSFIFLLLLFINKINFIATVFMNKK